MTEFETAQPKEVFFFPNGNTAFFDSNGKQIFELQTAWLLLVAEAWEKKGIDPTAILINMPDRSVVRFFRTEGGSLNWKDANEPPKSYPVQDGEFQSPLPLVGSPNSGTYRVGVDSTFKIKIDDILGNE